MTYATKGSGHLTHFNASPPIEQFGPLEYPRVGRSKLLRLQDILVESVLAVTYSVDHWVEERSLPQYSQEVRTEVAF